jgi:tetratricopeptide (TPR) repeat protein
MCPSRKGDEPQKYILHAGASGFWAERSKEPDGRKSTMRLAAIKILAVVLALLAVLLSAKSLLAGQVQLEQAKKLLSQGSIKEAVVVLRESVAADPRNADARMLLGTALALEGVRGESIEQLTEVVRLRPNSAAAHNRLGSVLSRFVETQAARREFEKALELDPKLAEAHVNLSLVLAQAGELDSAGEHLERAIEFQGNSPAAAYAHYLRGKIWAVQNQIKKSISELQTAVRLRPDYAEAWSELGAMRRIDLDDEGAMHALEKAITLDPSNALAQYRLGQMYLEDGEAAEAVKHLQQSVSSGSNDRATLYALARALRKSGKLDEAERIDKRMAELLQESHHASEVLFPATELNSQGMQLEKSGDVRAALAKYKAALDLDPSGYGFRLNYALALCRLGQWQDGVVELREVLRVDPDNADAAKALYIATEEVAKAQHTQGTKPPAKPDP